MLSLCLKVTVYTLHEWKHSYANQRILYAKRQAIQMCAKHQKITVSNAFNYY